MVDWLAAHGWKIAVGLVPPLAAVGLWLWRYRPYHLAEVDSGVLYRDGFRSIREFSTALRSTSPRTVVSLLDHSEQATPPFDTEADLCARHHAALVRIPVPLGGWPTAEDLGRFLEIVRRPENRPVLVHCAQGVRRTGMFVAAWQCSGMGWSKQQVAQVVQSFGHSARSMRDVRHFIAVYNAELATLTEAPPPSRE